MENPWVHLPTLPPYVLPADRAAVEAFQAHASPAHRLQLELLPEPFLGRPDAPVVLLIANPGFHRDDRIWHEKAVFANRARANLEHRFGAFPFHLLSGEFPSPAHKAWAKRVRHLRQPPESLAKRLACVALHGYRAAKFDPRLHVPSREYALELVRRALAREAVVVVLRAWTQWLEAVPELEGHPRVFTLNSPQSAMVTRKNCPDGFDAVLAALARPLAAAAR